MRVFLMRVFVGAWFCRSTCSGFWSIRSIAWGLCRVIVDLMYILRVMMCSGEGDGGVKGG